MAARASGTAVGIAVSGQRALVGLVGLALIGTGLWAILGPREHLRQRGGLPALHRHFIHDIGAFNLGLGATLGFALVLGHALLVALAGNAVDALAHVVSHAVARDPGGQASDPLTFGIVAVLVVGLAPWRARTVGLLRG